jgi:DNA adenine methylase
MASWVVERLPTHRHYIEACAGSAAIMAAKEPVQAETLNDIYGEVVNFFRVLQCEATAAKLIDRVACTPYALREFRDALDLPDTASATARAYAFVVRMQMAVVPGRTGWSYSANAAVVHKANKPGRWAAMPELLQRTAQRFARVQVTDWDVCDLIKRMDAPGVLILIDPPYIGEVRPKSVGALSGYVEDEIDHESVIAAVLNARRASFAITHYPHPLYDHAGFAIAGDYCSYRDVPNGGYREQKIERLYVLDRQS